MTYCVGLNLRDGLVMLPDTRANAGVDNIATFGKMRVFEVPGERVICLLSAGNLALTQIGLVTEDAIDLYGAIKLALISMDSTLRSNRTVGLPIDLLAYTRGTFQVDLRKRITEDDAYFRNIRESWSSTRRDAYRRIPKPDWPS